MHRPSRRLRVSRIEGRPRNAAPLMAWRGVAWRGGVVWFGWRQGSGLMGWAGEEGGKMSLQWFSWGVEEGGERWREHVDVGRAFAVCTCPVFGVCSFWTSSWWVGSTRVRSAECQGPSIYDDVPVCRGT